MEDLTFVQRNDVFTNSWIISQNIGFAHKDVIKHIRTHKKRFDRNGGTYYAPSVKSNGGRPITPIALNETQAVFLMTLLGNAEKVLDFKEALSREFIAMRRLLLERQTADWQQARLESKAIRLKETDAIKELVGYAKSQGSTHSDMLYTNYSKLVKQLAAYDDRSLAATETLTTVILLERIITGVIWQEMALNTHYKAIYQRAKAQLTEIMKLWTPRLTA